MPILVGTTTPTRAEADAIAEKCVLGGIAACVHIDEITSTYMWDGVVERGTEYRVFVKTVEQSFVAVKEVIARYHSYDLPAVFCLQIVDGTPDYLKWIEANSSRAADVR